MRLFAFALREYDELGYLEECSRQMGFEFGWTSDYPSDDNLSLAQGYDALSIITNPMPAGRLQVLYDLGIRGIATRSIGYDHIDVAAAHALGMRVGHAAYPPEGVANYAIMLMMMAARRVKLIDRTAAAQDFSLHGKIGLDLSSATVGVVGTGRIGATVVRHLQGFGCRVLASDPYPKDSLAGLCDYVSLDDLLAQSDIVTLHAPGLPENHHMIGAAAIARMRPGAILVNAARGSLVDTAALVEALEGGHLGGAALDTIENEANLYYHDLTRQVLPNRDRAVLEALPNVVVTPHMAFYTEEDVRQMVATTCSALLAFSRGEETEYEVR